MRAHLHEVALCGTAAMDVLHLGTRVVRVEGRHWFGTAQSMQELCWCHGASFLVMDCSSHCRSRCRVHACMLLDHGMYKQSPELQCHQRVNSI
jgi:hypothetical protein